MIPSPTRTVIVREFSVIHSGIARELRSKVGISLPFDPQAITNGKAPVPSRDYFGIWDTGATGTCITKKVIDELGLAPIGKQLCHHAQGSALADKYIINVKLPNDVGVPLLSVVEAKLYDPNDSQRNVADDADVLIGMDIISMGDFLICNAGGKTIFEFRVPSVSPIHLRNLGANQATRGTSQPSIPYVGRNDQCPCGSGKKYKKCHGASI